MTSSLQSWQTLWHFITEAYGDLGDVLMYLYRIMGLHSFNVTKYVCLCWSPWLRWHHLFYSHLQVRTVLDHERQDLVSIICLFWWRTQSSCLSVWTTHFSTEWTRVVTQTLLHVSAWERKNDSISLFEGKNEPEQLVPTMSGPLTKRTVCLIWFYILWKWKKWDFTGHCSKSLISP